MSEKIVHITDASFQSTLEEAGDKPVFVDFWAPWCGPCRMLAPSLDAAADAYDGKALICKYNVDENSSVASANGIRRSGGCGDFTLAWCHDLCAQVLGEGYDRERGVFELAL